MGHVLTGKRAKIDPNLFQKHIAPLVAVADLHSRTHVVRTPASDYLRDTTTAAAPRRSTAIARSALRPSRAPPVAFHHGHAEDRLIIYTNYITDRDSGWRLTVQELS
jgi:hypothetical protein